MDSQNETQEFLVKLAQEESTYKLEEETSQRMVLLRQTMLRILTTNQRRINNNSREALFVGYQTR
jgi:hypothetical protein